MHVVFQRVNHTQTRLIEVRGVNLSVKYLLLCCLTCHTPSMMRQQSAYMQLAMICHGGHLRVTYLDSCGDNCFQSTCGREAEFELVEKGVFNYLSYIPKELAESGTVLLILESIRLNDKGERKLIKRWPIYISGITWSPTVWDVTINLFSNWVHSSSPVLALPSRIKVAFANQFVVNHSGVVRTMHIVNHRCKHVSCTFCYLELSYVTSACDHASMATMW